MVFSGSGTFLFRPKSRRHSLAVMRGVNTDWAKRIVSCCGVN